MPGISKYSIRPFGLLIDSDEINWPLLAPAGSAAAPQYSLAADTDTGMWLNAGRVGFVAGGGEYLVVTNGAVVGMHPVSLIAWGASNPYSGWDTRLYRDAAGVLAQRSGTDAQEFRIYKTYTDSSNYERLTIDFFGEGDPRITPESAGTGTAHPLRLGSVSAATYINGGPQITPKQVIWDGTVLYSSLNSLSDIGSAASRWKDTYTNSIYSYNSYTNASNYERARLYWTGNEFQIASEALGTGTQRNIQIDAPTTYFTGDIVYEDTFWDDMLVELSSARVGAATYLPVWTQVKTDGAGSRGVYAYAFSASNENESFFAAQLPHKYKQGTDIYPHVHWGSVGTDTGDVSWNLEYTWVNIDGTFGNTTSIEAVDTASGTAGDHQVASFSAITGTSKNISSVLLCRFYRNPASGNDDLTDAAFAYYFDFHFEVDTPGSDAEFTK